VRYTPNVIRSFRHKGLHDLWFKGGTSRIDGRLHERIQRRLDALDQALEPEDLNVPGYDFHVMRGRKPRRYTVHVNGPWCITFEFESGEAGNVDFEQYH
jgi:proteic killer suppression protein